MCRDRTSFSTLRNFKTGRKLVTICGSLMFWLPIMIQVAEVQRHRTRQKDKLCVVQMKETKSWWGTDCTKLIRGRPAPGWWPDIAWFLRSFCKCRRLSSSWTHTFTLHSFMLTNFGPSVGLKTFVWSNSSKDTSLLDRLWLSRQIYRFIFVLELDSWSCSRIRR